MGFFKPIRDFYFLGAFRQTFFTFRALVSALVLRNTEGAVIHELAAAHIVVHNSVIVNLEDAGDFHLIGTGNAIAAAGAGRGQR